MCPSHTAGVSDEDAKILGLSATMKQQTQSGKGFRPYLLYSTASPRRLQKRGLGASTRAATGSALTPTSLYCAKTCCPCSPPSASLCLHGPPLMQGSMLALHLWSIEAITRLDGMPVKILVVRCCGSIGVIPGCCDRGSMHPFVRM